MTAELRELLIFEELERASNISQRDLADRLGMSVGLLNRHIRQMIQSGDVRVVTRDVRPFAYRLTAVGKRQWRRLRYAHYNSVLGSFYDVEWRVAERLHELKSKGVRRLVFYGAGEVMELAHPLAEALDFEVVAVVDDDATKHGERKRGLLIQAPLMINTLEPEAVLITTFRHADEIRRRIDPGVRSTVVVWDL